MTYEVVDLDDNSKHAFTTDDVLRVGDVITVEEIDYTIDYTIKTWGMPPALEQTTLFVERAEA